MTPIKYEGTMAPGNYYTDMPNDAYHQADGVSKSGLTLIKRSPAHFFFHTSDRKPSRAMEIGTAIHTALLEPDRFAADYMLLRDVKDRRSSEYKQAVKQYGAELVLTGTEADKVAGMQEAVFAHDAARELLQAPGWRELSGMAVDPVTGAVCRHRFDGLTEDGRAFDIKKTQDASEYEFSRTIHRYGYHIQAAIYADQYEWITGRQLESFTFIAVEEEFPHGVAVYTLDDDAMAIGRHEYRKLLDKYAECEKTNEWPCYPLQGMPISLPSYAIADFEAELEDGGII